MNLETGRAETVRTFRASSNFSARSLTRDDQNRVYVTSKIPNDRTEIWRFDSFPDGDPVKVMTVAEKLTGIGYHPDGFFYGYSGHEDDGRPGKVVRIDLGRQSVTTQMAGLSADIEDLALYYDGEAAAMAAADGEPTFDEADAVARSASTAPVGLVAECVWDNGDGSFLASFGYDNQSGEAIYSIPVGDDNFFWGNRDQGQPHFFAPGRHRHVFGVTFDGPYLVWMLNSNQYRYAVASRGSERCPERPTFADPVVRGGSGGELVVSLTGTSSIRYSARGHRQAGRRGSRPSNGARGSPGTTGSCRARSTARSASAAASGPGSRRRRRCRTSPASRARRASRTSPGRRTSRARRTSPASRTSRAPSTGPGACRRRRRPGRPSATGAPATTTTTAGRSSSCRRRSARTSPTATGSGRARLRTTTTATTTTDPPGWRSVWGAAGKGEGSARRPRLRSLPPTSFPRTRESRVVRGEPDPTSAVQPGAPLGPWGRGRRGRRHSEFPACAGTTLGGAEGASCESLPPTSGYAGDPYGLSAERQRGYGFPRARE